MNEHRLRDKVRAYLNTKRGFFRKIAGNAYMAGIPDFVGCVNGRWLSIELKKDKKSHLTPLQEITIKAIEQKGGGLHFTAYGWDDFIRKFEYIYEVMIKWPKEKSPVHSPEQAGKK